METPINSTADLFRGDPSGFFPNNPVHYDLRLGTVLLSPGMGQTSNGHAHIRVPVPDLHEELVVSIAKGH
jgi:hypothetical protein